LRGLSKTDTPWAHVNVASHWQKSHVQQFGPRVQALVAVHLKALTRVRSMWPVRVVTVNPKTCARLVALHTSAFPRCKDWCTAIRGEGIFDIDVAQLVEACPHLSTVLIVPARDCMVCPITDRGISSLSRNCTNLKWLTLCKCARVTTAGIASIAQHCQKLQKLDFFGCLCGIDDDVVKQIALSCRHLIQFSLVCCLSITDASITAISQHAKRLKILNISCNPQLTEASMNAIADSSCLKLKTLVLKNCAGLVPGFIRLQQTAASQPSTRSESTTQLWSTIAKLRETGCYVDDGAGQGLGSLAQVDQLINDVRHNMEHYMTTMAQDIQIPCLNSRT